MAILDSGFWILDWVRAIAFARLRRFARLVRRGASAATPGVPAGAVVLILLAGCGARDTERLTVFAAASTTDVVAALAAGFDGKVSPSFGATGNLARQIEDGAPADVFISANRRWIEYLRERDRLDGEPVVFATNRLVCVTALGSELRAGDPAALLDALGSRDQVAIADAGVPAGEYARQALNAAGLLEAYQPRLVGQTDVRAVLRAVANREVAAGFVYATDAKDVQVLFEVDAATHDPIEYLAATLKGARNPKAAREFVAYLRSERARAMLAQAGFSLPEHEQQ